MIDHDHWLEAQDEEMSWWGDCANTYWEEHKQLTYAKYMGLEFYENEHSPYNIEIGNKKVVDIGGGPSSLLLKTTKPFNNLSTIVDPCEYPPWVYHRYAGHGIIAVMIPAENWISDELDADEVWMYNCLQHTQSPAQIIQNGLNALTPGGVFRVFEWINTPTNEAHPHSLTKKFLDEAFQEEGHTVSLAADGCYGEAYYGVFQWTN